MDAWDIYKNNLTLDFLTSKYENLIEDFDNHTLKILEFLGVGWDENIKNYKLTGRSLNRNDKLNILLLYGIKRTNIILLKYKKGFVL